MRALITPHRRMIRTPCQDSQPQHLRSGAAGEAADWTTKVGIATSGVAMGGPLEHNHLLKHNTTTRTQPPANQRQKWPQPHKGTSKPYSPIP